MSEVVWSAWAFRDLDSISEYLKPHSKHAAETYLLDIRSACLKLAGFPESGRQYDDRHRVIVARNHIVFYRYSRSSDKVRIVAILDGRRDLARLLKTLK